MYVSSTERDKILISQLTSPNSSTLQTRMDGRRTLWKWILAIFKYKNEYHRQLEFTKGRWKNAVVCLLSIFLSQVMVLKLSKIVHFCKFVLTSARNLNILKQFISMHPKDLIMFFQKIVFFIGDRDISRIHEILNNEISRKVLTQQKFNKIHQFQTLISFKL